MSMRIGTFVMHNCFVPCSVSPKQLMRPSLSEKIIGNSIFSAECAWPAVVVLSVNQITVLSLLVLGGFPTRVLSFHFSIIVNFNVWRNKKKIYPFSMPWDTFLPITYIYVSALFYYMKYVNIYNTIPFKNFPCTVLHSPPVRGSAFCSQIKSHY